MTATDYDSFANAYSAENEPNLFNAYYERPEMLRLAGDVSGRRILDAGCGSGPLSAALRADFTLPYVWWHACGYRRTPRHRPAEHPVVAAMPCVLGQRSPANRSSSGVGAAVMSRTRTKVSTPISSVNRSWPSCRKKMFSAWLACAASDSNFCPP
ncbi:hypothetical protein GA0074695_2557 [Micromonospora viridifaciens]|uniref:Methyltransferase domain-containing protein n=1 Tax=Micromonospora viridifaciens TaxID=1881 RepID=A0A1C4WLC9_MICVI|nr:hypothetical protein GA0074695_2557 [Micromonospora viridifaciens]